MNFTKGKEPFFCDDIKIPEKFVELNKKIADNEAKRQKDEADWIRRIKKKNWIISLCVLVVFTLVCYLQMSTPEAELLKKENEEL